MKIYSFILFLIIGSFHLFAHIPQLLGPQVSPNATSLGEYGEVPVSPFTGVPLIEIPLYKINISEYEIPITLNYHAGGVRPDQHPGWVGMGWTLNAGGCISRITKDSPDEYSNDYLKNHYSTGELGYYYQYNKLNIDWSNNTELTNVVKNIANSTDYLYDTEPDKFCFNFLGYRGEFYLNTNGEWQVQCDKPIKVVFGGTSNDFTMAYGEASDFFNISGTNIYDVKRSHSFKKFTIIDEYGTQYIFGGKDEAIEFSFLFFSQESSFQIANTWHLTKIIYPNQREVEFGYNRGHFLAQLNTYSYSRNSSGKTSDPLFKIECNINYFDGNRFNGYLIIPSYLSYIRSDNTHISFSTSISKELEYDIKNRIGPAQGLNMGSLPILRYNGINEPTDTTLDYPTCLQRLKWHQLDRIYIHNGNALVRMYKFNYSNDTKQRLTLNSVVLENYLKSDSIYSYQFEYNNPTGLPGYLNRTNDHWGFYNGTSQYVNKDSLEEFYQKKEPNPEVALYGTLCKITYPTGGYSKFIYEPHDYGKKVSLYRDSCIVLPEKKIAGGIRIKQIVNSPTGLDADTCTVKRYHYVSDYLQNQSKSLKSSGVLLNPVKYYFTNYTIPLIGLDGEATIDAFCSLSVLPFTTNSCGTHIGYSEVVEEYPDGSFSIFKYSNADNGYLDEQADVSLQGYTIYEPYSSKDQERGLLLSKTEYNTHGDIQNHTTYNYERNGDLSDSYVGAIFAETNRACDYVYYTEGTAYKNYTYTMRPKTQVETIYNGNDSIRKETSFTYNGFGLVESITTTQSDSTKQQVRLKYPDSYSGDQYVAMVKNNRIAPVIEKEIGTISGYAYSPNFKENYRFDTNPVKPSSVYYAYGSDSYHLVATYIYDNYYNVIQYNPINGPVTSYIWGYKGLYPVAEITGVTASVISEMLNNLTFASAEYPDTASLNQLRTSLTVGSMTTYFFNSFGSLCMQIDPNGRCTTYYYDILGRLVAVKDEDGNYIEVYNYNYAH